MASLKQNANEILTEGSNAIINVVNLDKKYTLVRRGVKGDGSCFFHALFADLCGSEFLNLSDDEKREKIKKIRENIADAIGGVDTFKLLANGALAYIVAQGLINKEILTLKTESSTPDQIKKMCPETLRTQILNLLNHVANEETFNENVAKLFKDGDVQNAIKTFIQILLQKSFEKYEEDLKNSSVFISDLHISLIHSYLGVNILLLTPKGKLYIRQKEDCQKNGLPFIIMYYVNENHFEPVFSKLDNGNFVGYFNNDDPLIDQILKTCA